MFSRLVRFRFPGDFRPHQLWSVFNTHNLYPILSHTLKCLVGIINPRSVTETVLWYDRRWRKNNVVSYFFFFFFFFFFHISWSFEVKNEKVWSYFIRWMILKMRSISPQRWSHSTGHRTLTTGSWHLNARASAAERMFRVRPRARACNPLHIGPIGAHLSLSYTFNLSARCPVPNSVHRIFILTCKSQNLPYIVPTSVFPSDFWISF